MPRPSQNEWDYKNTSIVTLKLNHNTDADILEKLSTVESKQGYIKSLIRTDIGILQCERNSEKGDA